MEIKVTHMRNTSLFRMLEILRNKLAYQIFVDIGKVFYDLVSGDLVYLIKCLETTVGKSVFVSRNHFLAEFSLY